MILVVLGTDARSLFADENTFVVPSILATQDVHFGSGTLWAGGYHIQEIYGAQHFPTQAIMITELRFRPDSFYGFAFTTTVASIEFNLSTTTHGPDELSSVFANNSGPDETVVFEGQLDISSQFIGASDEPKVFDIRVPLDIPFIYDPSAGNLLLDIRNFSGSGACPLSGKGGAGDAASRLLGAVSNPGGNMDSGVDALEIVYTPTNLPPPPPRPLRVMRGPYLQSGTTSNIVVRWRTQPASDSRVKFGLSSNSLDWTVDDSMLATEHIVTLTNLAPDTRYYYCIGSSLTNLEGGPDYFFFTAPISAKPTRIWAIGDAGSSTQPGQFGQYMVRDGYSTYTAGAYTDIWLMLGDNAYYGGTDDEYQVAVFNAYRNQLRSTILWPTIGNHDVGGAYFDILLFRPAVRLGEFLPARRFTIPLTTAISILFVWIRNSPAAPPGRCWTG